MRTVALLALALLAACRSETPAPRPAESAPPAPEAPAPQAPQEPDPVAQADIAAEAAIRAMGALAAGRKDEARATAQKGLEQLHLVSPQGETARARLAAILAGAGDIEEARLTAGRALKKLDPMEIDAGARLPALRVAIATAMAAADQEPLADKVASPLSPQEAAGAWRDAAVLLRARGATEAATRAEARADRLEAP